MIRELMTIPMLFRNSKMNCQIPVNDINHKFIENYCVMGITSCQLSLYFLQLYYRYSICHL